MRLSSITRNEPSKRLPPPAEQPSKEAHSPAGLHEAGQALEEADVLLLLEVVEHFLQQIQTPQGPEHNACILLYKLKDNKDVFSIPG